MLLQVSVSEEEDEFQLVITACLSVLILGTETKLDSALIQMTRLPWASLESVRSLLSVSDLRDPQISQSPCDGSKPMWKAICPSIYCLSERGCKPGQWPVPAKGHMRVWKFHQARILPCCTPQWQVSQLHMTMRFGTMYEQ